MPSDEKVVPWEDHYVIGQGFLSPANVPVNGYATAFDEVPLLGTDLDQQATPGSDKIAKTLLTNNEFEWKKERVTQVVQPAVWVNEFEWTVAESYQDMAAAIAGSASFGVKGLGYSGSGTVESSSRTSVTQQSVVGILSTRFETHSFMLKDLPKLSQAALDVIAAQGAEGFYQVFGTDFIAGQRLGGSFMGIIDVRLDSEQAKIDFAASVKANYGVAGEKISGAAAFNAAIASSGSKKDVKVKWVAKGWDAAAEGHFGGNENPEELLKVARSFAHKNSGVPVAAILRPFTSHPQFVDAVFRREGPALSLPPTVKEAIIQKIQLEAIQVNILAATLSEFSAVPSPAIEMDDIKKWNNQLEVSRYTMARLEADPHRLSDLAIYMEHRPWNDNPSKPEAVPSEDVTVPGSVLEEEVYQLNLQLQYAKSQLLAAQTLSNIKNKKPAAATVVNSSDLRAADRNNGEPEFDSFWEQYIDALKDAEENVKKLQAALDKDGGKNGLGFQDSYRRGRSLYKAAFVSEDIGQDILAMTAADLAEAEPAEADVAEVIQALSKPAPAFNIQSYEFGTFWELAFNGFVGDGSFVWGALRFNSANNNQLWTIVPTSTQNEVVIALNGDVGGPWGDNTTDPLLTNSKRAYLRMEPSGEFPRITVSPTITEKEIWIIEVCQQPAGCVTFKNKAVGRFAAMPPPPASGINKLVAGLPGRQTDPGIWPPGLWEPLKLNFVE